VRSSPLLIFIFLAALALVMPRVCFSQIPRPVPPFPSQTTAPTDPDQEKREHDLAKKANEERQAQLKRDTENLLKLATELKQSVDKSNANTLSLDVIRKAEDIEKLAHSIKDKMKGN
jgi:hypothetical protein